MADKIGEKTLAALGLTARGGAEVRVTGLSVDSRVLRAGQLFAALPGTQVHGAAFVAAALARGAGAILTDAAGARLAAAALADHPVPLIVAEDPRAALSGAAALWFGAQPATMAAVTGTNGKTSVATFARQIWTMLGHEAVNIGTTGVEGAWTAPVAHTTPEPITLHRLLAGAAHAGITHAVMEASSHGLDQRRLDGVDLRAAAFTNFSRDHFDYHPDEARYFAAKAGLFTRVLQEDGCAVINTDDPRGPQVAALAEARGQHVMTVGHDAGCDLQLAGQRFDAAGQEVRLFWQGTAHQLRLGLIGGFQALNVAVAAGLVLACGDRAEDVFSTLSGLEPVRGRMQLAARRAGGAPVFVDYAHTPDALDTALRALRPHVMGRLVVVFGAGGDRDRGKRPLMGRVAATAANVVFVTDDNPRTEDPAAIRAEILQACPDAHEVPDRAEAILRAVDALGPGDALLIAGKGHETGQIVGDDVLPFDDAEQASVAVAALEGGP